MFLNVEKYANTSAAALPIAIDEAVRSGRIVKGDLMLLVAFGGGFTWGADIVEWTK
jgi:3-oxoacyl-[acyl-carrier-protein] synthase-3